MDPPQDDARVREMQRDPCRRQMLMGEILDRHRSGLRLMVALRLSPRLKARVDPSDVVQDVCVVALARLETYLDTQPMPMYLWLRRLTEQALRDVHRHHFRLLRDARRDVSLQQVMSLEVSSAALAKSLCGRAAPVSDPVVKQETRHRLEQALNEMGPADREILALRHTERLSNAQAAAVLGITGAAASKRYLRSLARFRDLMAEHGGKSPGRYL